MKATKKAQYALRAMILLAKKREVCSLRLIAKAENISFDYLEKIFSRLEKGGLVNSKRGATGGYTLSRVPEEITLRDIFNAVEEEIAIVECIKEKCPRDSSCRATSAWREVNKKIEEALSSITLNDLIKR